MAGLVPILRRTLAESWRSLPGWTIGVVAALGLYLPLFPSIGGSASQMQEIIDSPPPELAKPPRP